MATKSATKLFPTRNDLPGDERSAVIDLLNRNLLHLMDLYSQVKYAHWNIKGLSFYGVHKMLDELAERAEESIDEADEHGDKDTADLFTDVSRTLDKDLWLIEAHIQK